MKINFESDYDLPLGKIINIPVRIITVRSVFEENKNYYVTATRLEPTTT